jgi:hypothetical protein
MKIPIPLIVSFLGLFSTCMYKGDSKSYTATIVVTDSQKMPIPNKSVKFIKTLLNYIDGDFTGRENPIGTAVTNEKGEVTFDYSLDRWDSGQDFAVFIVDNDSIWRRLNIATHGRYNGKTSKQNFSLILDSLGIMKVRLLKTKPTPLRVDLSFYGESDGASKFSQGLFGWRKDSTQSLDSTFKVNVFTKAPMQVEAEVSRPFITVNGIHSREIIKYVRVNIIAPTYKDSVLTIHLD